MANPYDAPKSPAPYSAPLVPMTSQAWLICIIAAIGFAFDIYELLMLPLVLRPALNEFFGANYNFELWYGMLFFIPAFAGGIFGLLGGYLTDRFGRRFILTWSILLYAVSAFLAGYSTNVYMLLFFRCTMFIGVCIEFVAAVAWLAELFPNKDQREKVLGYTQAFSSIGGLLVAIVNSLCIAYSSKFPAINVIGPLQGLLGSIDPAYQHNAWRYTLMSGLIPAIPLIIIRPFLPESPVWAQKKAAGTLKRPSIGELFSPKLRRTTIVTTIMFACSYGVAFGAIQHLNSMVPGLKNVQVAAKAAGDTASADAIAKNLPAEQVKKVADAARGGIGQKTNADYTKIQEIGGLVGRFLLAFLAIRIASRQKLLRLFQVPNLLFTPLFFWFILTIENQTFFTIPLKSIGIGDLPVTTVSLGMFVAGLFTVAQFSFWGNYLPLVYPVHLRGTGESFAANIGGRMIGTSFALVTSTIAGGLVNDNVSKPAAYSMTTAGVAAFVIIVGLICSFFLPEPKHDIDE
jgi:MFS family permease